MSKYVIKDNNTGEFYTGPPSASLKFFSPHNLTKDKAKAKVWKSYGGAETNAKDISRRHPVLFSVINISETIPEFKDFDGNPISVGDKVVITSGLDTRDLMMATVIDVGDERVRVSWGHNSWAAGNYLPSQVCRLVFSAREIAKMMDE